MPDVLHVETERPHQALPQTQETLMAFKSKAQKEKMEQFLKDGKISQAAFDKMAEGTPDDIPERKHPKKDSK